MNEVGEAESEDIPIVVEEVDGIHVHVLRSRRRTRGGGTRRNPEAAVIDARNVFQAAGEMRTKTRTCRQVPGVAKGSHVDTGPPRQRPPNDANPSEIQGDQIKQEKTTDLHGSNTRQTKCGTAPSQWYRQIATNRDGT